MAMSQATLVSLPFLQRTDLDHIDTNGMPRMRRKLNGSKALRMLSMTSLVV
jgi:hypothetical protein